MNQPKVAMYCRFARDSDDAQLKRKTAIYTRVAIANSKRIIAMEKELLRYAKQNGYDDCVCYSDNGASSLHLSRPGMMKMLSDIRYGKVNRIIVPNISRLTRDYLLFSELLGYLAEQKVELVIPREYGVLSTANVYY
jgi:DNA invertase Pin-like site-specific DNA recombinase